MAIDYWKLSKQFKEGDVVQRYFPQYGDMSPFVGRVTAVHPGIGFIDVQWPFGNDRISAEELVICNPAVLRFLPPTLDQSYSTYDVNKARKTAGIKDVWRTTELPPGFHRDMAMLWSRRANEMTAYDELWHRHAAYANDEAIRDEVSKFYQVAHNFFDIRIQEAIEKKAAYWVAQNRQYRVTQQELASKCPSCPKCGTAMRRTTYKMSQGERARLFACPKDLYLLKREDLLGPDGGPVGW